MKVALIGNPNSGKSTLFNLLTGLNQRVGNFTGVTIEKKEASLKHNPDYTIVDLPGVYSLEAYSPEERVSAAYINDERPDIVVDVVDSTDLKKSLPLIKELSSKNLNLILALNMSDELRSSGISIDVDTLSALTGARAVTISAKRKTGIKALVNAITEPQTKIISNKNFSTLSVDDIYERCSRTSERIGRSITEKIDSVVLNRYLAVPIFLLIMLGVFFLSIDLPRRLSDSYTVLLSSTLPDAAHGALTDIGVKGWLAETISYGVLRGVGTVVGFLPSIIVLFVLIAFLEGTGYMSRVAVITDALLNKIGLSGRAFVPLITGCGCTVPAIMASRIIEDEDERILTLTMTPFVPCSAKLPVFALVVGSVTDGGTVGVLFVYLMSVVAVVITGLIARVWRSDEGKRPFVMELPRYRLPSAESLIKEVFLKTRDFLTRAGSVILLTSVAVWLLSSYDFSFERVNVEESILYSIGRVISPVLIPIGITSPEPSIAFLTGVFAKENVAATLGLLSGGNVESYIARILSVPSAYAYVTLILLFPPCTSALIVMKRESGRTSTFLFAILTEIAIAYELSMLVYATLTLYSRYGGVWATVFASIVLVATCLAAVYYIRKRPCAACGNNCVLKTGRRCDKIS